MQLIHNIGDLEIMAEHQIAAEMVGTDSVTIAQHPVGRLTCSCGWTFETTQSALASTGDELRLPPILVVLGAMSNAGRWHLLKLVEERRKRDEP